MAWRRVAPVAVAALGLFVVPADAHAVSSTRFDAPIPLTLLYVGTAVTIALTAGFLVTTRDRRDRGEPVRRPVTSPATTARLRRGLRFAFFTASVAALLHGIVGRQAPAENLATVFVWPLWIEGLALVAAIVGSPWRTLSPWRAVYDGLTRLEGNDIALLGPYPARLGAWPALAFLALGVGILGNLTLVPRSPRLTTAIVAGYALCMIVGGLLFGRSWFRHADALSVLYRLFGRVAPIRISRTDAGGAAVEVRAPWSGCTTPLVGTSSAAFVVVALYTVTFDGFTNASAFQTVLLAARDLGFSVGETAVSLYLGGTVGFLAVFALVTWLTERASGRWNGPRGRPFATLAPTVLPVAVGYEFAHYYPYVLDNLGLVVALLVDAGVGIRVSVSPLAWLSIPAFWFSQVVLIVGGHVVAVVAAHHVLAARVPAERLARATVPLTALMIVYTVLSLWIVSRPVVV